MPVPTGWHHFHDDRNLNFQLNRALFEGRVEDIAFVAPRIRTLADWKRELWALAERADGEGRDFNAFAYYRAAEFFMALDDPDRDRAYDAMMAAFARAHPTADRHSVPFDGGMLPALRVGDGPRGTLVVFAGFDAYIEEFYELGLAFAERGFTVIMFDGPGQGTARHRYQLAMTPEWHRPVAAVLDHFGLDDVTALGISLGGCLVLRAAAEEDRIRRAIAFDVMADFYACMTSRKGAVAGAILRAAVAAGASRFVDRASAAAMRRDMLAAWGIPRAMYLTATATPYAMFRAIRALNTRDCSARVRQDVLILAGENDHFVPVSQYHDQLRWLTAARSVTGRLFRVTEGAGEHCQLGNVGLAIAEMDTWIAAHR
jgi:alpha-beta hydrolase superfamily lysophospholipase